MNEKDSKANQNNPNHPSYWTARGYSKRPLNWKDLIDSDEYDSDDNSVITQSKSLSTAWANPYDSTIASYRAGGSSTVSTRNNSAVDWAQGGAMLGAGLGVLGKIIYDACNENEQTTRTTKNTQLEKFNSSTSTRTSSAVEWEQGGAMLGAELGALGKIIYDAYNENEQKNLQERTRRH